MSRTPRLPAVSFALLVLMAAASACTPAAPSASAPASTPTTTATERVATATNSPSASPSASTAGSATASASATTAATGTATGAATPRPTSTLPPAVSGRAAVEIERGTPSRREVAYTFDCAANDGPTDEILRVLREENVRVTWFMVGLWVERNPELTKVIAREHELANHSWAHPDYRDLSAADIVADMEKLDRYLITLTGQGTKPLWRAPSGARDQRVLEAAAAGGWPLHIFWTIGQDAQGTVTGDNGDWRGLPADQVYANTKRALGLGSGLIIVAHCDMPATASTMRDTIRLIRGEGYRIVTMSEMLRP